MVTIIIRHANDEQDNFLHKHDKEITKRGKKDAKRIGKKLIKKYGTPDIIYCSPFMRTRQTLKYMLKYMLKHDNIQPNVIIDKRLSTTKEKKNPSVFSQTKKKHIPIKETHKMFKQRCDSFLRDIKKDTNNDDHYEYNNNKKKVSWIITHVKVLKRICEKSHVIIPNHVSFLEHRKI